MDETEVETVIRLQAVDVRDLFPDFSPEDAGSRVCLLCVTKLKDKTHNLTRHLERHHVGALLQLMEQRNAASPSAAAVAAAGKTTSSKATGTVGTASTTSGSRTRKHPQEQTESKAHTKSSNSNQKKRRSPVTATNIGPHAGTNEDVASMNDGEQVAASPVMEADQIAHAKFALVEWLTREQLPISLVANDGFRRFVQLLNGKFDPPEHAELQKVLKNMHHQLEEGQRTSTSSSSDYAESDGDNGDTKKKKQRRVERKIVVETTALVAVARTLEDASVVRYQRLPCGVLQRGFAQVRVHLALASHSDAMACTGRVNGKHGVLGRSFVGIVERVNAIATAGAHGQSSGIKEQRVALASSRLACDACTLRDAPSLLSCSHSQYLGVSSSLGALSEYIVLPKASLHALPSAVPDDLALLVGDLALVIRTSNVIKQRAMEKVAVVTDGIAGCTIGLLARYVHQVLGLAQDDIHVLATSSIDHHLQAQLRQYATLTALDICNPSALDDVLSEQLAFDGVIDMCGTEASAEFAISLVQPMGTLMFVDRGCFEAPPSGSDSSVLAMDMNSVVVNELEMVSICDCSAEASAAVAYLAEQSLESESCDQLRAFLSAPVALGDALEELRGAGNELKSRYLQVDCRRSVGVLALL